MVEKNPEALKSAVGLPASSGPCLAGRYEISDVIFIVILTIKRK
jgi:hypothetical protein